MRGHFTCAGWTLLLVTALVWRCALTGMSQANGTTALTFTQPL